MLEHNNDSISIVLPIRNGEKYLSQIKNDLDANLNFSDELVVINDGSIDKTGEILDLWAERNPNITILHTQGIGLVAALNLGIKVSMHPWIARFDVDDRYSRNRLNYQRQIINDNVVAIFSDYSITNLDNRNFGIITSGIESHVIKLSLISSQRTAHSSVLFRKSAVIDVGGYLESEFPAEDLGLWLRLARCGDFLSVPETLMHYRLSKASISNSYGNQQKLKRDFLISKYGIPSESITYCNVNIKKLMNSYNSHQLPATRKLLLLQDLWKSSKDIRTLAYLLPRFIEVLNLRYWKEILRMLQHWLARKLWRFDSN
jgi:glycosyltransferase involved in cell wall biosynthesis